MVNAIYYVINEKAPEILWPSIIICNMLTPYITCQKQIIYIYIYIC